MPTPILMSALLPTMTEGNILSWLKHEGDFISSGEALVSIETNKTVIEAMVMQDGMLDRILIQAGRAEINTPVAFLQQEGEATLLRRKGTAASTRALGKEPAVSLPVSAPAAVSGENTKKIFATPLARRLAQSYHVDLSTLRGSGPHGRIIKANVEHAMLTTAPALQEHTITGNIEPPHELLPHTAIRRTIACRMVESVRHAPHFTLTADFEMDAFLALRAELNAHLVAEDKENREDERRDSRWHLSVNDLLIKACALALRKIPAVNVSFTEEAIRRYVQVNVAFAVNTPTGLFTPVIRDADRKGLVTITSEVRALVRKARVGRLQPEEYAGGTFSLSNLGMCGIQHFSAILNPPQACILAVGVAERRPVVHRDTLTIATLMTGTLSVDHRAVDGATAAHYLAVLKKLIEQPSTMLL
ncbi:Dihydrolipoamide acetyltransferase component of pyruvate dehydrogenase complex [invertebrate metagenome]|uniref:Dihydrolipoamide acetyltransferase component of pyruvate dehydrogenase complex n=1 Tax=invertebrate metagenome TaxID=1711999 RepID=A0A484H5E3_9ZZZZ